MSSILGHAINKATRNYTQNSPVPKSGFIPFSPLGCFPESRVSPPRVANYSKGSKYGTRLNVVCLVYFYSWASPFVPISCVSHSIMLYLAAINETGIGGMTRKFPTLPPHPGNLQRRSGSNKRSSLYTIYSTCESRIHFSRLKA